MDLVAGVERIIVLMDHVAKNGSAKFRRSCSLPFTGRHVVDMIITDLAVFERSNRRSQFTLVECARGVSVDDIKDRTEASFNLGEFAWP